MAKKMADNSMVTNSTSDTECEDEDDDEEDELPSVHAKERIPVARLPPLPWLNPPYLRTSTPRTNHT
jgi:hypothetical protein